MRRLAAILAILLTSATPARAQSPFAPLEFLVGSCWIGSFPGGKTTDEHCFEWVFDHKFIRDRHVVRGGEPYSGETIYSADSATKRITFQYYSSAGFIVAGTAEPTAEGIVFPQKRGDVETKSIWTRVGNDGYRVWNGEKAGAEWKTLWTMDLKRSAARTVAPPASAPRHQTR
ncbi:MAG: hypothetical protein ABIY52_16680 [Gemmatimonadaceae bacterium]